MDCNLQEKIMYLLPFINEYIEKSIYDVLNDFEKDPQYSAVTTANIIKCYIDVMTQLGEKLPYSDVDSYFKFNAFNSDEYEKFENIREKESKYYIGKIY